MGQLGSVASAPSAFYVYSVLVLVGIVGAVGDATVNKWALTNRPGWWILSCVIWILAATLFGFVLRWQRFTFGGAVVLALLVHQISVLFLDHLHFGGRLTRHEWIGIACASFAIYQMEVGRPSPPASPTGL